MRRIRYNILIIHPNEIVRCGLATMLSCLDVGSVESDCRSQEQGLALIQSGGFDLLVLSSSDGENQCLLDQARERKMKVILLLTGAQDGELASAVQDGVDGCLLLDQDLTLEYLDAALHQLALGGMPMPATLTRQLLARSGDRNDPYAPQILLLTPRERQVLALLAKGLTNKQIARRLTISEHGVKRHVSNVLAKLNCPSRTLAVVQAMKFHLLPLGDEGDETT